MRFEIDPQETPRIQAWLMEEVYPALIKEQRESGQFDDHPFAKTCWEDGFPYAGAIGGGITYSFSPTSIGLVTKVSYLDRFTLDLTDYESW